MTGSQRFPLPDLRARPVLFLLLLVAGSGCGSGDTIVLVPTAPICDHPPDDGWRCLVPLSGLHDQVDGVWLPDDTVVIVGGDGLVLTHDHNGWRRSTVPGVGTFRAACATDDGDVIAVGSTGAVAVRRNDRWSVTDLGLSRPLNTIVASENEVWAVGGGGQVVRGESSAAGIGIDNWRILEAPDGIDLSGVCVRQDTTFVCGEGYVLAWHDETWTDVTPPHLAGQDIHSVVATDEGELFALADILYCRKPHGWQFVVYYDSGWPVRGGESLEYAGGILWLNRSDFGTNLRGLLPRGSAVAPMFLSAPGVEINCAPRDSLTLLAFSRGGGLRWYRAESEFVNDPAGLHGNMRSITFDDGAQHVITEIGQYRIENGVLTESPLVSDVDPPDLFAARSLAGVSATDFYYLAHGSLYHCLNGVVAEIHEFETDDYRGDLVVDITSDSVFIGYDTGLFRWDGIEMIEIMGSSPNGDGGPEVRYDLRRTGGRTVVAWSSNREVFTLENGLWFSQGIQIRFDEVVQVSNGDLMAYYSGNSYSPPYFFKIGEDVQESDIIPMEISPACPNLSPHRLVDHSTGIYVATSSSSAVYRAEGDLRLNSWNLAAGSLEDYINELFVRPDGSLAVITDSFDRLFLYQPDP